MSQIYMCLKLLFKPKILFTSDKVCSRFLLILDKGRGGIS